MKDKKEPGGMVVSKSAPYDSSIPHRIENLSDDRSIIPAVLYGA
ncbi:MAG TPA: hypothetical protein VLM75_10125 [Spirochaetota bacterium]|nr:hypothetical protein [Spirochaetota bacterium]